MANYNPTINVNMTTPELVPDVPVLHSAEPSWGEIAADTLTGVGSLMQMAGQYKAGEESVARQKQVDAQKQLELDTGNNFARDMQKLVAKREQTGNQVAFEQEKRALMNRYLSSNILKATDLSKIAGDYDEGYAKLGEASRERWSKYDDEALQKTVTEMKSKYTYLNTEKDSDVLSYVNRINTSMDFGNTLQQQMNSIDPTKYPEEYNRLKQRRDAFYEQNVVGQTLLAIQQNMQSNGDTFTDPTKLVQFEQAQVAHLIRQGVTPAEAAVTVHQAMTEAGAYQPWAEIKQQMGASQQFMQDALKYKQDEVDYALNQSVPQLMTAASLKKAMGDNWTSFAISPAGSALKDSISVGVEQFVKGNVADIRGLPADQQQTGVDTLKQTMATSAPAAIKGVMLVMTGKGVAGDGIKGKKGIDAKVVLKNAEGMSRIFQSPYSQIVKRSLLSSPTASQQGLGIELQKTEEKTNALVDIYTYMNSPIKGANDLRYFLDRTTMSDNLRVDGQGRLVYVAGTGLLEAAWEGLTAQGNNITGMLNNINDGYAEFTKASPQNIRQMWINAGISPVQAGERAMQGPSIIETLKQKVIGNKVSEKEMREIDAALASGQAQEGSRLDPEVAKLYDELEKDLKPNVKRAVEDTIRAVGKLHQSEKIANASIITDPYAEGMTEQMIDEHNQKQDDKEREIFIGKIVAEAAREAEPDSEEFKEWMQILQRINKKLKEYGVEPMDPYGEN